MRLRHHLLLPYLSGVKRMLSPLIALFAPSYPRESAGHCVGLVVHAAPARCSAHSAGHGGSPHPMACLCNHSSGSKLPMPRRTTLRVVGVARCGLHCTETELFRRYAHHVRRARRQPGFTARPCRRPSIGGDNTQGVVASSPSDPHPDGHA